VANALTSPCRGETEAALLPDGANAPAHERLTALVVLVMAIATPLSIVFHYVCRYYYGRTYPWSTFMVDPRYHFGDYYLSYQAALGFGPGRSSNMVYSPLMHLLVSALTLVRPWVGFAIIVAVFLAVLVFVCWKWVTSAATMTLMRLQQVAVLVLLSYPVLFVIDRGNLEMVIFVWLAAFFYLYYGRRSRWAWIPLALAIAGKYYWVTLLVLPLCDRQIRQSVYALAGAVFATLMSGFVIAWNAHASLGWVFGAMARTLGNRSGIYGSVFIAQHAHTLWASLRLADGLLGYPLFNVPHQDLDYVVIAIVLFALIAYEVLRHEIAPWRRVLALVAATLVLPVESYNYTLLHLLFPLALLVCSAAVSRQSRAAVLLIALCLVPVDYYYFAVWGYRTDGSVSTFIYSGALVAMILIALVTSERKRRPLRSLVVWDAWSPAAPIGVPDPSPGTAR
jgi:hypothetical protein